VTADSKLSPYQAKRDFSKTTEPSGENAIAPSEIRRFVIQKHVASHLHYDFRLEVDGVLKSWAIAKGPSIDPHDKRLAVEVEDHPLDYGDFEGTIPKGQYGGGTVQLWDRGYWLPEASDPADALRKGELKFAIEGERLHGGFVLVRIKSRRPGDKKNNWLLIKYRDEFARDNDDVSLAEDRSVASGRTMATITAGNGRGPKPLILAVTKQAPAEAIWNSNGGSAADLRSTDAVTPQPPSNAARAKEVSRSKSKPRASHRMPQFIAPELCKLTEEPPSGPWKAENFAGSRTVVVSGRIDEAGSVHGLGKPSQRRLLTQAVKHERVGFQ
jgi:bifunctional non-homologous end joining protein LigD